MYIILCIAFAAYGVWCLSKAKHIKLQKKNEQDVYEQRVQSLQTAISDLTSKRMALLTDIEERKKDIGLEFEKEKQRIDEQVALYKDNTSYASEQYMYCLEKSYKAAEQEYDQKIQKIEAERVEVENALQNLRNELSAGVQAQLREREKAEKVDFYKIIISCEDEADIKMLNNLKTSFHQPAIISKLIWTSYFQKKVTEMCNRVLGNRTVCGIYKITNLNSQQCYIGQSVNISERWKQHCKCGCGIDAPATNKLYQDMIKTGIWNFSFELMEECPRANLNEKERFWIELYQSDIYGLNSTKGNTK